MPFGAPGGRSVPGSVLLRQSGGRAPKPIQRPSGSDGAKRPSHLIYAGALPGFSIYHLHGRRDGSIRGTGYMMAFPEATGSGALIRGAADRSRSDETGF
jgi:hypothetical protein